MMERFVFLETDYVPDLDMLRDGKFYHGDVDSPAVARLLERCRAAVRPRAVAACVYLARTGADKETIRDHVRRNYYPLKETLAEIRPHYRFDVTCQGSVPQAIQAFLESESFEDAIRGAISLGGDSDTQAAIAGSIAGPYFGIPESLRVRALGYLPEDLKEILLAFEARFGANKAAD